MNRLHFDGVRAIHKVVCLALISFLFQFSFGETKVYDRIFKAGERETVRLQSLMVGEYIRVKVFFEAQGRVHSCPGLQVKQGGATLTVNSDDPSKEVAFYAGQTQLTFELQSLCSVSPSEQSYIRAEIWRSQPNLSVTNLKVSSKGVMTFTVASDGVPWSPMGRNVGVGVYYATGAETSKIVSGPVYTSGLDGLVEKPNAVIHFTVDQKLIRNFPKPKSATHLIVMLVGNLNGMPQSSYADDQWALPYRGFESLEIIPDIMDTMGWNVPAKLQRNWFGGAALAADPNNRLDFNRLPVDIETVTMEWILTLGRSKSNRGRAAYNKIKDPRYFWNADNDQGISGKDNFVSYIRTMHRRRGRPQSMSFGTSYSTPVDLKNMYINNVPVSYKVPELDELTGALGRFTLCVYPQGVAKYDSKKKKLKVTILAIAVFAIDVFEFNGIQPLGFWSEEPPYLGFVEFTANGQYANNARYEDYRKRIGKGRDFIIMTRPIITKPTSPIGAFSIDI